MTTRPAAIARALIATTAALGLLLTAACSNVRPAGAHHDGERHSAGHLRARRLARLLLLPEARVAACNGNDQCADLRVPLDYAKPDPSSDLTIKVLRVPGQGPGQPHRLAGRQPRRPRRLRP